MHSVAATITRVSQDLVPASTQMCTDAGADGEMCGMPAEWVALKGPIYAMVASPRCIAHAVAASRARCVDTDTTHNSNRVRRRRTGDLIYSQMLARRRPLTPVARWVSQN